MWASRLARRLSQLFTQNEDVRVGPTSMANGKVKADEMTDELVMEFLKTRADLLEKFVMENVELEQLERWIIRRTQRDKNRSQSTPGRKTSLSRWKFCVHADKRQMLIELTQSLQERPSVWHVLNELGSCICSAVGAHGYRIYIPSTSDPNQLLLYLGNNECQRVGSSIVPTLVARTKEPMRISRGDPNFPKVGANDISELLVEPVVQPDGELVAVLELYRSDCGPPFYEEDEEIATSYLVWGGIALHYAKLYISINKQRKLSDFLLAVVKSIFQDMVSLDSLVTKVMNFAQRLVDADRASLFLLDSKNKQLYARIFDIGGSQQPSENDSNKAQEKEIRFSISEGIAGQVARTGQVLNIPDAYSDPRFNRAVDQMTGYHTKSILCMPIFIRGAVIGVMQMVNKHSGLFSKEDEESFEMFAIYCGLALHHAKLYDKIRRSEQKYRVAMEVLCYHNTSTDEEIDMMKANYNHHPMIGIDEFTFNVFDMDDDEKARHAIYMFKDLGGENRFDRDSIIKFVLTVKKNYRRVPYHNWTHGFCVANTMYVIFKSTGNTFTNTEKVAMYVSALCHDLDHRGKNNKYMLDTESPLAGMYSTSTMEHHHFNQTITILQQTGHNIFAGMNSTDYKQVLGLMKHCILATDLAKFFPYRASLQKIVDDGLFNITNFDHRSLLQAVMMTACDLSASAKPWELQVRTAQVIFEEFYQQGDAEKAVGRIPIPMMDRDQPEQQAASQVGFLTGICVPCYSLLSTLLPPTLPLLETCKANLERWRDKTTLEDATMDL